MPLETWLTLIAILLGPLIGVLAAHVVQRLSEKRKDKYYVFETLITFRRQTVTLEFCKAVNIVPVLYQSHAKVLATHKVLRDYLEDRDGNNIQVNDPELQNMLSDLLVAMADVLGLKLSHASIRELNYLSQGAANKLDLDWSAQRAQKIIANQLVASVNLQRRAVDSVSPTADGPEQQPVPFPDEN